MPANSSSMERFPMKKVFRVGGVFLFVLLLAALAYQFWPRPNRASNASGSSSLMSLPNEASTATSDSDVIIPTDSLERLHLKIEPVAQRTIAAEIRVPGLVQPNAYQEVHVTPLIPGVVTKVFVELGQMVKRGQPLAQLFSNDLAEAQTQLISLQAELEAAHKKLQRIEQLVLLGAASQQELEEIQSAHQVHLAHAAAARQKLLLLGLTQNQVDRLQSTSQITSNIDIPAPIDGFVTTRTANLGQVFAMGQEMFTITDLSSVWIVGDLFEQNFNAVRTGSRATITTNAYPGKVYRGEVSYIDPRVDAQTRTAKVRIVVANPGGLLRLGMYADVLFATPGGQAVVVIPSGAIQSIGSTKVAFVSIEGEGGRFQQRTVKVGDEIDGRVSVLEGLKPNEKVVTEGSFLLRAEALRQHAK